MIGNNCSKDNLGLFSLYNCQTLSRAKDHQHHMTHRSHVTPQPNMANVFCLLVQNDIPHLLAAQVPRKTKQSD